MAQTTDKYLVAYDEDEGGIATTEITTFPKERDTVIYERKLIAEGCKEYYICKIIKSFKKK